jgi:hypothetical protein
MFPDLIRSSVEAIMDTVVRAVADRFVLSLPETSTMRALPCSLKCVKLSLMPAPLLPAILG